MKEQKEEDQSMASLNEYYQNQSSLNYQGIFFLRDESCISQRYHQSSEYFKNMESVTCSDYQRLKQLLRKGELFDTNFFRIHFEKMIESKTGNSYIFSASVGCFQTKISMLRINMKESFIRRNQFSSGGYASIYIQQFETQTYIIKSQKISKESITNFDRKFDAILQEYFIYKLASILQFGPKMKNIYGFDIVCFDDSLEFSMELCKIKSLFSKQLQEECESDLLVGMKIMHTLQLVHRDIKTKNIAWSPSFRKWVFLDFGFSSFIEQKPGEKTFTSFRGTYEYTSKQLKNLYHLKTSGFVNLYQNDLYGIKSIKMENLQKNFSFIQNSSLFSLIIFLSRMRKYTIQKNYAEMEKILLGCFQLRDEFLKLVTIQLERQKLIKSQAQQKLYTCYLKLKQIQLQETDKQKIQSEKQKKQYFTLFMKEEQNSNSMWIFGKQSDLKRNICQRWGQLQFMKEVFIFFSETLYSNSAIAWSRINFITNVIIKFLIPNCEKKNWLWNFHYILKKFQQKFLEKNQFMLLQEIFYLYSFCNDQAGQERLSSLIQKNTSQKNKILKIFCKLFLQIVDFRSIDSCRQLLFKVKQVTSHQKEKQCLYDTLERIAELMLNCMLRKSEKEQYDEFDSLFSILNQETQSNGYLSIILEAIEDWKNRFFKLISDKEEKVRKNNFIHYTQNKHIVFLRIIDKINQEMKKSSRNLIKYFKTYPLLLEIPNKVTFFYYLRDQNFQKVNEITENIVSFNTGCLEEITSQLEYLHHRWNRKNTTQLLKQKKSLLKLFLASYKNRLMKSKEEIVEKYWEFYSMSLRTDNQFVNLLELQKQVVNSLKHIIEYFTFSELSASNKVYINLFLSLKMFFEERAIKADDFLQNLQKNLLIEELKQNKRLLWNFIQIFTFYQNSVGKYYLHETFLFLRIQQDKILNWLFYESPLFFSNTINVKAYEKKYSQAFELIISHTMYLSNNDLVNGKIYGIFIKFLQNNTDIKYEMMLFFLQSGKISCFRKNNYLSSVVLIIYLLSEADISNKMKLIQIKRIYILSAVSIDKFPERERIQLRKMLKYKFRDFFSKLKPRKKKILNREDDYCRDRIFFLKREYEKIMEKSQIYDRKFKIFFNNKLKILKQNLLKNPSSQAKLKTLNQIFK